MFLNEVQSCASAAPAIETQPVESIFQLSTDLKPAAATSLMSLSNTVSASGSGASRLGLQSKHTGISHADDEDRRQTASGMVVAVIENRAKEVGFRQYSCQSDPAALALSCLLNCQAPACPTIKHCRLGWQPWTQTL